MSTDNRYIRATEILPERIKRILNLLPECITDDVYEIRLRAGAPVMLSSPDEQLFVTEQGTVARIARGGLLSVCDKDIDETYGNACGNTIHAHTDELIKGFVTLSCGHRVGICGRPVYANSKIIGFEDISSLNIRISRQVFGAANQIMKIFDNGLCGVIIAGPPASGKTTLLRDIARQLSRGYMGRYIRICVIDERNELSATFRGNAQNELGFSTDIITGIRKCDGIEMATRCLSPEVIICDEAGNESEAEAISAAINTGTAFVTSIHAGSNQELRRGMVFQRLTATGAFSKVVLLSGRGSKSVVEDIYTVGGVRDENGWNYTDPRSECLHIVDKSTSFKKAIHRT